MPSSQSSTQSQIDRRVPSNLRKNVKDSEARKKLQVWAEADEAEAISALAKEKARKRLEGQRRRAKATRQALRFRALEVKEEERGGLGGSDDEVVVATAPPQTRKTRIARQTRSLMPEHYVEDRDDDEDKVAVAPKRQKLTRRVGTSAESGGETITVQAGPAVTIKAEIVDLCNSGDEVVTSRAKASLSRAGVELKLKKIQ